ncbi:hypothetical protein WJX73_005915 [Symbiochloris irregularis]|uniref:Large ribosomal subunit protein uL29c n=1 Tax=Symbiochloris irregularis TaxID=706552 RepID=A0AAW1NMF9_9CHLO
MQSLLLQPRLPCTLPCPQHSASPLLARRPLLATRTTLAVQAKPTRAAEFRSLSEEEIDQQVEECKKELFRLRFKIARKEAFKPSDVHWNKKKIAQLLTVKREREVEKGVSRRESRLIQKRKNVALGFGQF